MTDFSVLKPQSLARGFTLLLLSFFASGSQAAMDSAYDCAAQPKFIAKTGMQQPVAIDTQQSRLPGLVIKELRGEKRTFRHPSWSISGYLASTVRDRQGNIYAVPTPSIGLDTNPLARRNHVYKVDSDSGKMTTFVELPTDGDESQMNPFGTLGLTLDCDRDVLFVSSVADSTPTTQRGAIYQIDLVTGEVLRRKTEVDAIGLGIFNTGDGKRVYFGDARSSSVYSIALNADGSFGVSTPQYELSLLHLVNGNSTQVRKIRFVKDRLHGYLMIVSETEFAFRLAAHSVQSYRHYKFAWSAEKQKWHHIGFN